MNPLRALGCNSLCEFDWLLFKACSECFGWTKQDFIKRWRPRRSGETFTTRPRVAAEALRLYPSWLRDRDPEALYSHPEFFMGPAVSGVLGPTPANITNGMRLLRNEGVQPKRILDFGCGCGFTLITWAMSYPDSELCWADIPNTRAETLARWFVKYVGIEDRVHWSPEGAYDLLCAFEVVEHLWDGTPRVGNPFHGFDELLSKCSAWFLHATQWRAEHNGWLAPGHFEHYVIDDLVFEAKDCKGPFERAVIRRGFDRTAHGWNGQPVLFKRIGSE